MKTFSLLCALLLSLVLTSPVFAADQENHDGKVLKHVVCFKFKDTATKAQIAHLNAEFAALSKKIPGILDYEAGENNSPEGKNNGFTHCYIVTFKSEKDRAGYLPHPAHQAFIKLVKEVIDDVFVIDFWTK